jgi:hypothetical protein
VNALQDGQAVLVDVVPGDHPVLDGEVESTADGVGPVGGLHRLADVTEHHGVAAVDLDPRCHPAPLPVQGGERTEVVGDPVRIPLGQAAAQRTPHLTSIAEATWNQHALEIRYPRWAEPHEISRVVQPTAWS